MDTKLQLIDIPTKSRKVFSHFINECNKYYRSGHDLKLYRDIIRFHRETKDIDLLIGDNRFLKLLYDTLEKWNMNQRAAELTSFGQFAESIIYFKPQFKELYEYELSCLEDQLRFNVFKLLHDTFTHLKVMESKRRIVGVSKTLHFLLPDLVMPIDSKYTMTYFYGYNKYSKVPEKEFKSYQEIFDKTHKIVRELNLTKDDVKGGGWNTSVPKLIDNSIIGFTRVFVSYYDIFGEDTVKKFMALLEQLTAITPNEKKHFEHLLAKEKNNLDKVKRKKVMQELLIEKATKAGITVSEEEIGDWLEEKERIQSRKSKLRRD